MYFIFKHVEFSRYRDRKGKYYHYDEKSPNFEKVREGAKVLLYQKESNEIFALAKVSKIEKFVKGRRINFLAFYSNYKKLKNPLELNYEVRKKLKIKRNLELPSPGIIPIEKEVYEKIVKMIKSFKK